MVKILKPKKFNKIFFPLFQSYNGKLFLFLIIFFIVGFIFFFFQKESNSPRISDDKIQDAPVDAIDMSSSEVTTKPPIIDYKKYDSNISKEDSTVFNKKISSDVKKKIIPSASSISVIGLAEDVQRQLLELLEQTTFSKKHEFPTIFIVIDDIGYSLERAKDFLTIPNPITFAILPNLPQSSKITNIFQKKRKSILLHMPMQPKENQNLEKITLLHTDNSLDIQKKLSQSLITVPYSIGISNHMGSSFVKDSVNMDIFMQYLKNNNLFFLDSKTGSGDIGKWLAKQYQVIYYSRDIFLDNSKNHFAIAKQLIKAAKISFGKGSSIAIGHPYKQTYQVLAVMMPQLESIGVRFQDFSKK